MSSAIQNHHQKLLEEFADICQSNGIGFVLSGHAAWDAIWFQKYHGDIYETMVLMLKSEFDRLREIEMPEGRKIVDFKVREYTAKYADMTSVLMNYEDGSLDTVAAPGVEIEVVEPVDGMITVGRPDGETFEIPVDLVLKPGTGVICDREYPTIGDEELYFSKYVGENWRKSSWEYFVCRYSIRVVYEPDFDPIAFKKLPVVQDSIKPEKRAFMKKYWEWVDGELQDNYQKYLEYVGYLRRTEYRFQLWEQYYPQKAELMAMAQDESRHDELAERLAPLIDRQWEYWYKWLPFSIDEDILQLSIPFFEERYGAKKTANMVKAIPKEYREQNIADILRERGVDHPALR